MIEWAPLWDLTYKRWVSEGLEYKRNSAEMYDYFGLDQMVLVNGRSLGKDFPRPESTGGAIIKSRQDYIDLQHVLYPDENIRELKAHAYSIKERHDKGEVVVRLWLDGFFWHPRVLFGIEEHFYSFYDFPELMHEINTNLCEYNIKVLNELLEILEPDIVGLAEDMSYNKGPMLSEEIFNTFIKPYYEKFVAAFSHRNLKIFVDSDGDVMTMIPWLIGSGIDGIYPLERQSNVDVNEMRRKYPKFLMMGGYDKRVMSKGEESMRREFERILPAMAAGGYIPSVDHQTPPDVSMDDYKLYIKLFGEYAKKAVELSRTI
jgi:hypothetical protein